MTSDAVDLWEQATREAIAEQGPSFSERRRHARYVELLHAAPERPPAPPRIPPSPYCYVCTACVHPAHLHGLVDGGDLRVGPYRCECGCEIAQDAPMGRWDQRQYEQWRRDSRVSGVRVEAAHKEGQ